MKLTGIFLASALTLYYSADHHTAITMTMNATCEAVLDTHDPYRPHDEQLRLVYQENPRFVERLAGPALPAELRKSGQSTALVTSTCTGRISIGTRRL